MRAFLLQANNFFGAKHIFRQGIARMSYSATAYPFDCVLYMTMDFGGQPMRASAAIIGPHTILTASHCLWDATTGTTATNLAFWSGHSGPNTGTPIDVSGWVDHYWKINDANDSMDKNASQQDYAIVDVKQDLTPYGWFGVTTDSVGGNNLHITGYPAVNGELQSDQVGTAYADSSYHIYNYGSIQSNKGNSGGPIWFDAGTPGSPNPQIVGVASTSTWAKQLTASDWQQIQSWENSDSYLWANPVNPIIPITPSGSGPTTGNDYIVGSNTPNTINLLSGDDTFRGGSSTDNVNGNDGNDLIYGNLGGDQLFGNMGRDTIYGGQGADYVRGGKGDDAVFGDRDNDLVYGDLGNDIVHGGKGDDTLFGGKGNDSLFGDLGNDTLIGGLGADRYVFGQNSGADLIQGFSPVEGDRLDIQGQSYSVGSAPDGSALITLSGGGTIDLAGVAHDQVNASFFSSAQA